MDEDVEDTAVLPTARSASPGGATGADLAPGDHVGEYVIEAQLAVGGCGAVYAAKHRLMGRRAALKLLHAQLAGFPGMLERFVREARAVNMVKHPNIVDVFDFGEIAGGRPYFVMELLEGSNLEQLLREHGIFSVEQALELLEPVCGALQATHAAGIIHRDLKASNVFVADQDGTRVVKLLDFGIAKLVAPDPNTRALTTVGTRLGTPYAMAPEQIRCEPVTPQTDIYALGILLFHLLTARHPFEAPDVATIERAHLDAPPPKPSTVAPVWPAVDAVVLRCLEKDPQRRFPSAEAFLEALRAAASAKENSRSVGRAVLAVGILAEVRVDDEDMEVDDEVLEAAGTMLDMVAGALRESGFLLPLETGNSLLGVQPLSEVAAEQLAQRRRAIDLAREITTRLAPVGRLGVRVNLCVHVEKAIARTTDADQAIVGGALLNIGSWAPKHPVATACATSAAVAGLSLSNPTVDGYVLIS